MLHVHTFFTSLLHGLFSFTTDMQVVDEDQQVVEQQEMILIVFVLVEAYRTL